LAHSSDPIWGGVAIPNALSKDIKPGFFQGPVQVITSLEEV
jgi:hypothetical protein